MEVSVAALFAGAGSGEKGCDYEPSPKELTFKVI